MNNTMSIIIAYDDKKSIDPSQLILHRTTSSLPFGGRYRFIDFALSNLVNSGVTNIGILTKDNYSSLMDHIRMGRDWDLNRKNSGIAVFPPYSSNLAKENYKNKLFALKCISDYIYRQKEEYVILTNGNCVMNVDYDAVLNYHIEKNADITVLSYNASGKTFVRNIIEKDENDYMKELCIDYKPFNFLNEIKKENTEECLGVYLLKRQLLLKLISECEQKGLTDIESDIIRANIKNFKIAVYKVGGYACVVDNIRTYYEESMKLLETDVRNELFYKYGKIFTKVKDSVPTLYQENAEVKNSLIADGCVINGKVENSILFRGVVVEEGAKIVDCILMENGIIKKNANLQYLITDKEVTISEGKTLIGHNTYYLIVPKGKTI